jgi:GH24 family phage-related lysozyme (muramidase)
MLSNSEILKEFLMKLGYKVDEQSYKDFQNKFDYTVRQFSEMGKVAAAAGIALAASITKTASEMEKLYFVSQRTGSTGATLKSLRFAAEQIGISADTATGLVENLAQAMRQNPGKQFFFAQLGLKATGDATKDLLNLVDKLQALGPPGSFGYAIATQIASQFGMSEQDFFMLAKNRKELAESMRQQEQFLKNSGVDTEKLKDDSHKFMEDFRTLVSHTEALALLFEQHVLPYAEKVVVFLTRAVDEMVKLDKATGGWSTTIGGIVTALGGAWASLKLIRGALGVVGIGGGGAAAAETGAAAAGGGLLTAGGAATGALVIGDLLLLYHDIQKGMDLYKTYKDSADRPSARPGKSIEDLIAGYEGKRLRQYKDAGGFSIGYGHRIRPGEDFSGGISNQRAMELLAKDTLEAAQAVQRLVKVRLSGNQFAALTDFMYNAGSGDKVANSTLLRKLNSGDYAGAAAEFERWNKVMTDHGYEASDALTKRRLGERALFERPDVNIEQHNTVHVTGTDSPQEAAKAIGDEQRRQNGTLLRNLTGAMN